ncbi:hypothetical protein DV736_g1751, partial [Chaetothyriales sp. CBS 134916]
MGTDLEDEYDHLSQEAYSDSDSHALVEAVDETPRSSPPDICSNIRIVPSRTKRLHCTWEGCDKAFVRQSRLDEHLRTHTNTRIFTCPEAGCTKSYFRDSHLKVHIKSAHWTEKNYKCNRKDCSKSFATGQRLRNHIKSHECREKYKCTGYEGCSQAFRKKEMLRRHVVSVHEKRKPFPCADIDSMTGNKCTKEFDTAQKLRNHQKTNHDETRYSCSECLAYNTAALAMASEENAPALKKAYFATLVQLQGHNADVHPPTCPQCQAICSTQRQLKAHLEVVHDILSEPAKGGVGKARVVCPHEGCGKSYSKTGNLNVHIRTIHERSLKFICGESQVPLEPDQVPEGTAIQGCGKTYSGKQALADHIRSEHLGFESLQSRRKRELAGKDRRDAKRTKRAAAESSVVDYEQESSMNASDDIPAFIWPAIGYGVPSEDEEDDTNGLSESMSLLGSHIFHRGETFHYPSGEYPSSSSSLELCTNPYQPADQAEDQFFGEMDGLSNHNVLDPRLLFEHTS